MRFHRAAAAVPPMNAPYKSILLNFFDSTAWQEDCQNRVNGTMAPSPA